MNFGAMIKGIGPALKAARLPHEEAKRIQEAKLRKILRYAYENSGFYHRTFSEAGITEDNIDSMPIEAFPTTDKTEIMDNYEQVLTVSGFGQRELVEYSESGSEKLFRERWHVVHSSGSTGEPRYYIYDDDEWNCMVLGGARSALWGMSFPQIVGLGFGRARVLFVGATGANFGGNTMVDEACQIIHAKKLKIDINEPLDVWTEKVRTFHPNFVIGYPSALEILTSQLRKENIQLSLRRIISCGEALTPNVRRDLEDWFGIHVINFYACTESLVLGVEPSAEEKMYLSDDLNYIEVIDGKMYLTVLYNFTQPLIRYYLTDRLEMLEPYEKGCTFSRCLVKYGKAEDVLWFEDSKGKIDFLHPFAVEDFCVDQLLGYQFIQESKQSFRVDIVTTPKANAEKICDELRKMVQAVLTAHKLRYVTFGVRHVPLIQPDVKTGKCRLCIALPEMGGGAS